MVTDLSSFTLAILPEIGLVVLAVLILALDLAWKSQRGARLGAVTAAGLALIIVLAFFVSRPAQFGLLIWGGMLRFDFAGYVFRMIFLAGAAITALFASDSEGLGDKGEFYILLLVGTLGMSLMASAANMVMLFLAIETTSIPLYVLSGFQVQNQKSVEAGLKYLLYGAMASTLMLFGFALLYGFSGTTQLYEIAASLKSAGVPGFAVIMAGLLVLAGFGFKISAVPFHFWAPDVYEGAPTPVAGFLSTASKAAGFIVLLRVLQVSFVDYHIIWTLAIAVLSIASMFTGNLLALAQKNLKRLLAYSSIAQAGYILIGVAAGSALGGTAAVYYLIGYLLTNLAAFGIIAIVEKATGSSEISAFAGLSRRSPGLALMLLVALLSLGGVPPFAGFIGKLLVLGAAIEANMAWLAIIGIINSIIGLYYYLTVLKVIYLNRSTEEEVPLPFAPSRQLALAVTVFGVILLGVAIAPWLGISDLASLAVLNY